MITTSDIEEILMDDCVGYGVALYPKGNVPMYDGEERIVVIVRNVEYGKIWHRSICEINWVVPNFEHEEDSLRIKEIGKIFSKLEKVGKKHDEVYRYKTISAGVEKNEESDYHCVNNKVLFEILNVK